MQLLLILYLCSLAMERIFVGGFLQSSGSATYDDGEEWKPFTSRHRHAVLLFVVASRSSKLARAQEVQNKSRQTQEAGRPAVLLPFPSSSTLLASVNAATCTADNR